MKRSGEFAEAPEDEALFETANLSPRRTGLPFVVWISPKAGAPHDVRVKISEGPKVHPSELVSVTVRPDVRVVGGGKFGAHELEQLGLNLERHKGPVQIFVVDSASKPVVE